MLHLVRRRCLPSSCTGASVYPRRLSSSSSSSLSLSSTWSPRHPLRALSTGSDKGNSDIREAAELQDKVLRCLDATVFDPALPTRSIVDLGLVKVIQRRIGGRKGGRKVKRLEQGAFLPQA